MCKKKKYKVCVCVALFNALSNFKKKKMHIMSEVVINLFEMLESGRHLSRAI